MTSAKLNRRQILKALGPLGLGATAGAFSIGNLGRGNAEAGAKKERFLIVIGAAGGASIVDSLLAIRRSESNAAETLNVFEDSDVVNIDDSPLRAVNLSGSAIGSIPFGFSASQESFVRKHKDDLLVSTVTGTSVNHIVAQRRSITGNEAWRGRTLQELVALEYGAQCPLPNVNMATGGYLEHGTDTSLPSRVYNEPVADPVLFPLSLNGHRGTGADTNDAAIAFARGIRDNALDPGSAFYQTFRRSPRLARWKAQRQAAAGNFEANELLTKLLFVENAPEFPLGPYRLEASADASKVRERFPTVFTDPLEAQAALAFLLIKNRASVSVTISPSFSVLLEGLSIKNPPLAFDFSHNGHRAAQAIMWSRLFGVVDGLIDLLKAEPFDDATGESFWDRSMIYIATEFGRERRRPTNAEDFGTSHHLNNGVAIISPMVRGNTILGGVDPHTALTYGYDPVTGVPDLGAEMPEANIFSGILEALQVDKSGSGLPPMPIFRRA